MASEPNQYNIIEALIISFLLTIFITGVFAFVGFAYPSSKILSDNYYKIKSPGILNIVCKSIGIKYFQYFLLVTYWGKKKNRKKYFNGTKKGLVNFIFQTRQSEFGHLGAFLVILVSSLILLVRGYIFMVTIITIINILGNVYPVILQRSHRMRIEKITQYKHK